MIPRVCILLNSVDDFDFQDALERHLPPDRFDVVVTTSFPSEPSAYRLILLWSIRKIVGEAPRAGNVIVMHSSELPEGRGWAPIYHAFADQKSEYVISGIFAAAEVDTGDVIIRARFALAPSYTAPFVRTLDKELSLLLFAKILQRWPDGLPVGLSQSGPGSYRSRRQPRNNEVDPGKSLRDLIPHLRGVEATAPAYFMHENVKYVIEIRPESAPRKPCRVEIEYPASGDAECWNGWRDEDAC